jgi:hypothetical protein
MYIQNNVHIIMENIYIINKLYKEKQHKLYLVVIIS